MGKIYDEWTASWAAKDIEKLLALCTDDFIFEWHSSGKKMDKAAFKAMLENFVKADLPPGQKQRCIYENEEILVSHSFNKFPNGTVDAVMTVQHLKDGKICMMETGSTTVPEDSPNFIK